MMGRGYAGRRGWMVRWGYAFRRVWMVRDVGWVERETIGINEQRSNARNPSSSGCLMAEIDWHANAA